MQVDLRAFRDCWRRLVFRASARGSTCSPTRRTTRSSPRRRRTACGSCSGSGTPADGAARPTFRRRLDQLDPPPGAAPEAQEEHEGEQAQVEDEPGHRGDVPAAEHPDRDPGAGDEDEPAEPESAPRARRRCRPPRAATRRAPPRRRRRAARRPRRPASGPRRRAARWPSRGLGRERGEEQAGRDEVEDADQPLPGAGGQRSPAGPGAGTSSFSPAPIDCPTRMAPALARAKAGMKATELSWMTAMSAASAVVPRPATTTFTKNMKAANSKNQLSPDGTPKRSMRRNSAARSRGQRPPAGRRSRRKTASRPRKATPVESALASAAPAHAHGRRSQVAVDEEPVPGDVEHHGRDAGAHGQAGVPQAAVVVGERLHADGGASGPEPDDQVAGEQLPDVGREREAAGAPARRTGSPPPRRPASPSPRPGRRSRSGGRRRGRRARGAGTRRRRR